jgi:hypothetical protein
MKTIKYITLIALMLGFTACEDAITFYQDDDRFVLEENALEKPDDVQELLNSVYDVEANFLGGQMQNLGELLSDALSDPSGRNDDYTQIWNRKTDFFNGTIEGVYRDAYIAIFRANTLLEAVDDVPGVTPDFSARVKAESRFIRGLNHYMVVRLFAQPYVPNTQNSQLGIIVKTNTDNTPKPRSTVEETYEAILADLRNAAVNLPESNDVYATRWAAKALLAKVYLEMGMLDSALARVNDVIDNGPFVLDDLDRFEAGSSSERIFYVVSTSSINDRRGTGFSDNYRTDLPTQPAMQISASFFNELNTDTADLRYKTWLDLVHPGETNQFFGTAKFNFDFLDVPVLHLTEMLLIKAEVLQRLGNAAAAIPVLNQLRLRGNMPEYPTSLSSEEVYNAVMFERAMEMCFEGDRVFQLKRMGTIGKLQKIRGVDYNCPGMVLQFPNSEGTGAGFVFNPSGGCN